MSCPNSTARDTQGFGIGDHSWEMVDDRAERKEVIGKPGKTISIFSSDDSPVYQTNVYRCRQCGILDCF